jgi:hypothetical protein
MVGLWWCDDCELCFPIEQSADGSDEECPRCCQPMTRADDDFTLEECTCEDGDCG